MQGLESLDKFKSFVSDIGGLGRFEDTYIVHAAEGETVVPMEVLDRNPVLKERLFETMRDMGIQPERYIVGNEFNSINPVTGQPEFFLKWLGKRLKKGIRDIGSRTRKAAADISGYAAPIIGAMYGPAAGAAVGALLGQYKRENPGDPSQWKEMALRGGISGLGANIASGQGLTLGGGMRGIYNPVGEGTSFLQSLNPMTIGKEFLQDPTKMIWDTDATGLEKLRLTQNLTGGSSAVQTGSMSLDQATISALEDMGININNATLGESVPFLEQLLGKDTVMKMVLKFGLSKYLGDIIKDENEEAEKEAAEAAKDYGKRTVFSQIPSLMRPGEIVASPGDALTDVYAAKGGIMDLQGGGESIGPGTGTSDSIPAMLSDGEFVMTADAVRGAGGGDRREGARKMYQMMDSLERSA